jgi:hypothetical protein
MNLAPQIDAPSPPVANLSATVSPRTPSPTQPVLSQQILRSPQGTLGLQFFRKEGQTTGPFYIFDTPPDGPAAKSGKFRVGDSIIAIDGKNVDNLQLEEAQAIMRGPPASLVTVVIRQDQEGLSAVQLHKSISFGRPVTELNEEQKRESELLQHLEREKAEQAIISQRYCSFTTFILGVLFVCVRARRVVLRNESLLFFFFTFEQAAFLLCLVVCAVFFAAEDLFACLCVGAHVHVRCLCSWLRGVRI